MTKLTAQEWGLYIGQKVLWDDSVVILRGVSERSFLLEENTEIVHFVDYESMHKILKPILRDLSQMTNEEKKEYSEKNEYATQIECYDWLSRKGFAIRGEFERGVAIREKEK